MPLIENHPVLNIPKEDIILWRYMDIPSFIYLLEKSSLIFVRSDLFEDKYEGTLPKITASLLNEATHELIKKGMLHDMHSNFSEILNSNNKNTYINCWCKEDFEMIHMWKIYSKEFGIAIQTSYEKLKLSLKSEENVFPTEIAYIDFEKNVFDWKLNTMTVYTIKRKEYKSESEFRLIISHPRRLEDELDRNTKLDRNQLYNENPVIHCEIDTNILITKIHVSPYAPKWYNELIKAVLIKYNLKNVEVYQSNL